MGRPTAERPGPRSWLPAGALILLLAGAVYMGGTRHPDVHAGGQMGGHAGGPVTQPADTRPPPSLGSLAPTRPADLPDVVLAYRNFWTVAQTVDRRSPAQWWPILAQVTGQPLLDELLDGFAAARAHGTLQYGTVVPRPEVVELTADRATIIDCQDASGSGELDRTTGAVQKIGSARTPVAAVMIRDRTGRWVVTEARYLPDPC